MLAAAVNFKTNKTKQLSVEILESCECLPNKNAEAFRYPTLFGPLSCQWQRELKLASDHCRHTLPFLPTTAKV